MERHDENALIIYTDGSCKPNPRRGGYAFVILSEDEQGEELLIERNPAGRRGATNIEMELTACIEALRLVTSQHPPVPKSSYRKIVIYADLALIFENIYAAENVWPDRDWFTRENEPVINADLWEELTRVRKAEAGVVQRLQRQLAEREALPPVDPSAHPSPAHSIPRFAWRRSWSSGGSIS